MDKQNEILEIVRFLAENSASKQDLEDLRVATKQDLEDLRFATKQEFADLRAEMATKQDLHDFKSEILTHIDHFAHTQEKFDIELCALRDKCNRVEEQVIGE